MRHALTVAGSDSGGGAGIQADLKTFAALGVYGMSAVTAVTAQNTREVRGVQPLPPAFVAAQIDCVWDDIRVDAVKIGMTANAGIIEAVAAALRRRPPVPVVLDPVMVATSGATLLEPDAARALVQTLLPLCAVVTPNLAESEALVGLPVRTPAEMEQAARVLVRMGAGAAVVKGGHLPGEAVDVLFDGRKTHRFAVPRVANPNTHGTGCTFSSAVAAMLARGLPLVQAVGAAKDYVTQAIARARPVGGGRGPLAHFAALYAAAGVRQETEGGK